jgi:acetyl-CoA acetyltransferase
MVVTTPSARELSAPGGAAARMASRGALAHMPEAVVSAAGRELAQAGVRSSRWTRSTHNPFALNDLLFARETGSSTMNNYGCSLVWGHPQAPMGMRAVAELIEQLALRGGGWGLFSGCAAGDTAMAVVLEVGDA